jgi:hypothetical protein
MPSLPVGKITPIIFLVAVPTVAIAADMVLYFNPNLVLVPVALIAWFLPFLYGFRRAISLERYLKQGLEQVVVEIETVKKIFIVTLPIFSVLVVLEVILYFRSGVTYHPIYGFTSPIIGIVAVGFFIIYLPFILRKELRFYLSKACFLIALNKKDIFKQMYYFNLGLHEYDKYLKTRLKHQIKDIDRISLKVGLLEHYAKTKVISSLSNNVETENDKLKPLKYISSELMKSEDIESFLIPESLKSQLKVVGAFLSASIPIVISIIVLVSRFFVK